MKNETVIKVDNLTKVFNLPHEKYSTARQRFVNLISRPKIGKFKALNDISFSVKKGEFFSVIGANGSGKSTLLKILAGIYLPTSGRVEVNSRVSPFIELGVGFNPELTARENVFLNAAILGLSQKETEEKFEDIIKFAELEQFVDQKLKNFSSGMQVRLAFSIAIQAPAEILLVDEVLAVGDAAFQQKCFDVFRRLKSEGTTIVFVSHALNIVEEFSDRAIYLNRGKLISIGKPRNVINDYASLITEKEAQALKRDELKKKKEERWGDRKAEVAEVWIETKKGNKTLVVQDDIFNIVVQYDFADAINKPIFGLILRDSNKRDVYVINTKQERIETGNFNKGQRVRVAYRLKNVFEDGEYTISPAIANQHTSQFHDWRNDFKRFIIRKGFRTGGMVHMPFSIDIGVLK